jgi:hypothetical protein
MFVHCQKTFFEFIPLIPLPFWRSSHRSMAFPHTSLRPFFCDMSFLSAEPAVAAATTATPNNVRLDAFNEDNIDQWFQSHRFEFHNNQIVKPADKSSLARVKLPKSITGVYMAELDALFLQDDPYEALCDFIVSQFGRNKWAAYFDLLRLPCTVEDTKPSLMYARLKSLLPTGADSNNEIFMAMFLLRLPPSTREQVGATNHATVTAMVKHADRVWSFRVAQTRWSPPPRSTAVGAPLLHRASAATKRVANAPKVAAPTRSVSKIFGTRPTARASSTITTV